MISASIVTYKNSADALQRTIESYLAASNQSTLYVVDNSPTDDARSLCAHPSIEYIFNSTNIGYGSAHNIALKKAIEKSKYHLVLNPDVFFSADVIKELIAFMDTSPDVGLAMPKVLYPDGRLQALRKLLPLPHQLFARRFLNRFEKMLKRINHYYEMHFVDYNTTTEAPFLSGCFMMLRTDALKNIGLFDERFFLYFEDTDLSRRMHEQYRTVYFPGVEVFHIHGRGLHKEAKLLLHSIKSGIRYFNKWGWIKDEGRDSINKKILIKYKVNGYHHQH